MDSPPSSEPEKQDNEEKGVEEEQVEVPPFKPTKQSDLKHDVHMEADDQRKIGTLVARGEQFGTGGADAIALAELIKSYATTVYRVAQRAMRPGDWAAPPAVSGLRFNSAHIDFVAGARESIRMGEDSSPAIEAAQTITDLMQAHGEDLLQLAREIGPDGTIAYRSLLKAIGDANDAEVTWEAPGREAVTVTSIQAANAHRTLGQEGENESDEFKVVGHLSMADDDLNHFKLKLFKGAPKPRQLKGKQVVRGSFDDAVGDAVREKGLWGENVEALVRIERERADTVATPRDPKFTLLSVQATSAPPAPRKGREPMPGAASLDDEIFSDS
jgi:hypothetical protein